MKKLFSLLLSLMILLSSAHISFSAHYCGERLVDFSVFGYSDSCAPKSSGPSCESKKKKCCADLQLVKEGKDFIGQDNGIELRENNFEFITFFSNNDLNCSSQSQVTQLFYSEYSPPPLIHNVPIMIQQFLL